MERVWKVCMSNPMNEINQSKLNQSMLYIFSSNPNNYTFKKLDNMLINMPENDGKHALVRDSGWRSSIFMEDTFWVFCESQ